MGGDVKSLETHSTKFRVDSSVGSAVSFAWGYVIHIGIANRVLRFRLVKSYCGRAVWPPTKRPRQTRPPVVGLFLSNATVWEGGGQHRQQHDGRLQSLERMGEFGTHVHPISRATVVGVGPHRETKMARKNLHQCWPDGCVFGEFLPDIEGKQYDADLVIFEYDLA